MARHWTGLQPLAGDMGIPYSEDVIQPEESEHPVRSVTASSKVTFNSSGTSELKLDAVGPTNGVVKIELTGNIATSSSPGTTGGGDGDKGCTSHVDDITLEPESTDDGSGTEYVLYKKMHNSEDPIKVGSIPAGGGKIIVDSSDETRVTDVSEIYFSRDTSKNGNVSASVSDGNNGRANIVLVARYL